MIGKKRRYLILFLAVFMAISYLTTITAFADPPPPKSLFQQLDEADAEAERELSNPLKLGVYHITKFAKIAGDWLQGLLSPLFKSNTTSFTAVGTIQSSVYSLGMAVCFIYFLLDLLEHATRDTFTAEGFVKSFAKLMIMCVLFNSTNIDIISDFGASLNNAIIDSVEDAPISTVLSAYIAELKSLSWLKCIGKLFEFFIPGITVLVTVIVVTFVGLGRTIEIGVYTAFLPLGMASIYNGGVNSSGFRYFKKLVALHLQGAIMYGIYLISTSASALFPAIFTTSPAGSLVEDLILSLIVVALYAKSRSIANDVVGV